MTQEETHKSEATDADQPSQGASILQHLAELRTRMIRATAAFLAATVASYAFSKYVLLFLERPFIEVSGGDKRLQYLVPTEGFLTRLKVAALCGLVIASPYIFYQIWKFVAPGLYKHERRLVIPFVLAASFLFVCGVLFGYFLILPYGLRFLVLGFEIESAVEANIQLKQYISFVLKLMVAFGAAFELPVVIFFLARLGLVDASWLVQNFRYAIVIIFIVAAVITPPDILTQVTLAMPLILLYWISVGVAYVFAPRAD